ncbi:hypothetical protein [Kitasatospora azatica]|uniref:hypothetical protein n=1 Tax=Kitasatospora azatica TaxID=58347 RepID=UPI000691D819|nr:hypothetical protein [Kitasatospora azatica]
MRRRHSFHHVHAGHSVTVNIRSGWITETELLVDGKEVAFHRAHGPGALPRELAGELPGEPGRPFVVRIEHDTSGALGLACVLKVGGTEQPMSERTAV